MGKILTPKKHFILPDAQVRAGVPIEHLGWAGKYAAEKRPDVIVCLGDFGDLPAFGTHDAYGSLAAEGLRYQKDLDAAWKAMDLFVTPIAKCRNYKPRMVFTLGNHEARIGRTVNANPKLQGTIDIKQLRYEQYGWTVYPFLEPVVIGGFHYSHYFPSGVMGRPCTSPGKLLRTYHVSCVAGHQQGRQVAYATRGDGRMLMAIIAGSFYQHDEGYLTPLNNRCWRGCVMLHEVQDGEADEMFVSLRFLKRRYGR